MATAPLEYNFAGGKVEVHLDSPTGPLIGETPVITPVGMAGGANPAPSTVQLTPTTGKHKLYFVFKGEKKDGQQGLMTVSGLEFKSEPKASPGKPKTATAP